MNRTGLSVLLALIVLLAISAPASAGGLVVRPAVSAHGGFAVAEVTNTWGIGTTGGTGLGGELLLGWTESVLFGVGYRRWNFDLSNDKLYQTDAELIFRLTDPTNPGARPFGQLRAGYIHQSRERTMWLPTPGDPSGTVEDVEFTGDGFGFGVDIGLVLDLGPTEFQFAFGLEFRKIDGLESDVAGLWDYEPVSGMRPTAHVALALPIGGGR